MTYALEDALQVRFQNRLVGWLSDQPGDKAHDLVVVIMEMPTWDEFDEPAGAAVEERVYKTKVVSWRCDKFKLESAVTMADRWAFIAKNSPPYAVQHSDPRYDAIFYSWKAIKIDDYEEYEFIFDYAFFVPIETVPDEELTKMDVSSPVTSEDIRSMVWSEAGEMIPLGGDTSSIWEDAKIVTVDSFKYLGGGSPTDAFPGRTAAASYVSSTPSLISDTSFIKGLASSYESMPVRCDEKILNWGDKTT